MNYRYSMIDLEFHRYMIHRTQVSKCYTIYIYTHIQYVLVVYIYI